MTQPPPIASSRQGTWTIDVAHSSATFEAEHAGVSTFRGGFTPIDAKLVSGDDGLGLEGIVRSRRSASTTRTSDRTCSRPTSSTSTQPRDRLQLDLDRGSPDDLHVRGDLSMAGFELPVEATCRLRGPCGSRGHRAAVALARGHGRPHGVRHELADGAPRRQPGPRQRRPADRRARVPEELNANARSWRSAAVLRRDSHNTRLLRHLAEQAPAGLEIEVWEGLKASRRTTRTTTSPPGTGGGRSARGDRRR